MARQTLIEMKGNTGANTREKSYLNLRRTTGMMEGGNEETKTPGMEGGTT